MEEEDLRRRHAPAPRRSEGNARKSPARLIVPLFILVIATLIAREEVPAFRDWTDRMVAPQAWKATEACRKAAVAATTQPDYAWIIEPGIARKTQAGYFVDDVIVGELDKDGINHQYVFSCNVSATGEVVNLSRPDRAG
jgi:hypothetical protein